MNNSRHSYNLPTTSFNCHSNDLSSLRSLSLRKSTFQNEDNMDDEKKNFERLRYLVATFRRIHLFDHPGVDDILSDYLDKMSVIRDRASISDYRNIPANGYRSIIRSAIFMFELVAYKWSVGKEKEVKAFLSIVQDVTRLIDFYLRNYPLNKNLDNSLMNNNDTSCNGQAGNRKPSLISRKSSTSSYYTTLDSPVNIPPNESAMIGTPPLDRGREFLKICLENYEEMTAFLLSWQFCGINYNKTLALLLKIHVKMASLFLSKSTMRTVKNMFKLSKANINYVRQLGNNDPSVVAGYVRKLNWFPIRMSSSFLNMISHKPLVKSVSARQVRLSCPRKYKFTVTPEGCTLTPNQIKMEFSRIKVRVIRAKPLRKSKERRQRSSIEIPTPTSSSIKFRDTLIFLHGGGFLGPKARAVEEIFLNSWARKLPGVTILNVDFSLAPEAPFPIALQEVLDFYLWLTTSEPEDIESELKFCPRKIVLAGDSSGGNIAASLTVALHELERGEHPDLNIRMPHSLVLFFPKLTVELDIFPSLMLSIMDPLVNPFFLKVALQAYVPFYRITNNGTKVLVDGSELPEDWVSRSDYQPVSSHFISPLNYPYLGEIKDVNLLMMGYTFCPFLDEALEFCREWGSDKIHLETVDGLGHAGFYFNLLSSAAKKASLSAVEMVRKGFE